MISNRTLKLFFTYQTLFLSQVVVTVLWAMICTGPATPPSLMWITPVFVWRAWRRDTRTALSSAGCAWTPGDWPSPVVCLMWFWRRVLWMPCWWRRATRGRSQTTRPDCCTKFFWRWGTTQSQIFWLWMDSSPKNENSVINYSPSCC